MSQVRRSYMRCSDKSLRFSSYLTIWNQIVDLHSKGELLRDIPSLIDGDKSLVSSCFSDYTEKLGRCKTRPRKKSISRLSSIPTDLKQELTEFKKLETSIRLRHNREKERSRVKYAKEYRILKNILGEDHPNVIEMGHKSRKTEDIHPIKKSDVKSLRILRRDGIFFYQILKNEEVVDTIVSGEVDLGIATDHRTLSLNLLDLKSGVEKVITLKADQVRRNNYKYLNSLFKEIAKSCRFVFLNKHEEDTSDNLRDINLIIKRLGRARQAEGAIVFKIIQDSGILSRRRRKNQLRSQVLASSCMEQGYAEMEAPKVPPLSSCWFH